MRTGLRGRLAAGILSAMLAVMPPVAQGLHPDDDTASIQLCIACAQAYTRLDWDAGRETASLVPLDGVAISMAGMRFVFLAADDGARLGIDVERMGALIGAVHADIPEAYRRKRVETVIVIVSSAPYCLRYEEWTSEMRRGLTGDLGAYFTAEHAEGDSGGCCASFPNTKERERVIWLPVGLALACDGTMAEHANCAYSYHISCTEAMNLTLRLTHELVHALAISRTLPSLADYGFTPNANWELQWIASGKTLPALSTAEAFAYDRSRAIMRGEWPQMVIGEMTE